MEIKDIIGEVYDELMLYPNKIYEIFCDYYGEDRVDIQGFESKEDFILRVSTTYTDELNIPTCENILLLNLTGYEDSKVKSILLTHFTSFQSGIFILVHFPEVRITNEYDQYVDVKHLWARIKINYDGTMVSSFEINRSHYYLSHILSNYKHSHTSGGACFNFSYCCLGSGPIKKTCASLNCSYEEYLWQLFCLELDKYVATESISGGPYKRMSTISDKEKVVIGSKIVFRPLPVEYKKTINAFIRYLINNVEIPFNYSVSYGIAMSMIDWRIYLTQAFIKWYNDCIIKGIQIDNINNYLFKGTLENGILYAYGNSNNSAFTNLGTVLFTFKNNPIALTVEDDINHEYQWFLKDNILYNITNSLIKVFNFKYGADREYW